MPKLAQDRFERLEARMAHFNPISNGPKVSVPNEPGDSLSVGTFRDKARVTTYTVIGPTFSADDYAWSYGPHGQEVRVIP